MASKYNFDEFIDRKGTDSIKYDAAKEFLGATRDVIPMWVADMDFRTPDFVVNSLKKRIDHEIYAYSIRSKNYYESIIGWLKRRHQWEVSKEAIVFSPGVVPAVNMAVLSYTQFGDRVITQPPVYFPFFNAVKDHGRKLVYNPLILKNGRLNMDFENLEKVAKEGARMIIISSPHNPGGSVWTEEELRRLAEICLHNDILILSDEIHCDLVFKPNKHFPLASLSDEIADHCITAIAPSKTFNLSGLSTASVIITNAELRNKFIATLDHLHIGMGNIAGNIASQAAYTYGDEWVDELMIYLSENLDILEDYLHKYIPRIKMLRPEATFLVWLDCTELGMDDVTLNKFFLEKARLGLNRGEMFGPGGSGFMRMNIGCTKATLNMALECLKEAFR
ncbi:MAG: PatB family C-S lyase [Bacteroidales bacterium]|jgi:cystathionine beta-lyase